MEQLAVVRQECIVADDVPSPAFRSSFDDDQAMVIVLHSIKARL